MCQLECAQLEPAQILALSPMVLSQAKGKFDLKEPYYRQLNPQAAAATTAWPQQQEQATEHAGQTLPHQQHGYMEHGQGSAEVQQAAGYAWVNQHASMQQQPGHVPQGSTQQQLASQWNQQQGYQQPWQ